jgi:glycosyltransferase involved in cell wall biosynthesis
MPNRAFLWIISRLRRFVRPVSNISPGYGINVALVDTYWEVGGGQRQLLDFAVCSEDRGGVSIIAIVNASNHSFISLLKDAGVQYYCIDFDLERDLKNKILYSPQNALSVFKQANELRKIILNRKIDVVQFYNYHSSILGIILGLSRIKSKIMPMHLSLRDQTPGGVLDYIKFFASDAVTYNSRETQRTYASVARFFPLPRAILYSVVSIPSNVATSAEVSKIRNAAGTGGVRKIIGYFGAIAAWKNVDQFIEAVRIANDIGQCGVSYFAVIVGGYRSEKKSEYEEKIANLAECLIPNCYAIFPQRADIFPIMNECDVLVLPSNNEPYGRVLVEAMSLRVPFVAVKLGGPLEMWEAGGPAVGALVPPNDIVALGNAIVEQAKKGKMGHLGLPTKFSADEIIDGHFKFLRRLCHGRVSLSSHRVGYDGG